MRVLNVGGYIGESTRSEIEYAREHDKLLEFLEPASPDWVRYFGGERAVVDAS